MAAYLLSVVGLGSWFARGQHDLKDYFLAGRGMRWWPVAISIVATDLSAISYMGAPAWVYEKDMQYALSTFMLPVAMVIVVVLFVPLFYRLEIYTVYEYLGRRYNRAVRLIACVLFIIVRAGWLATAIFTPSLAIAQVTKIPLVACIVAVGMLTTTYTVLGGMMAVIWTDVLQFVVLIGGACAIAVVLVLHSDGGFAGIWHLAAEGGHTKMFTFSWDPTLEVTVGSITIGLLFVMVTSYGCDQVVVQRYFTTRSIKDSVRSVLGAGILVVPVNILLYFTGLALAAHYAAHPDLAPDPGDARGVLPHFIVQGLPVGVSGLLLAGIFAATMSSIDSGIQSLTTTTIVDLVYPARGLSAQATNVHDLRMARVIMIGWGVLATVAGLFVGRLGTFLEIIGKISGFFGGPLGGLFLLGVLVPRSNTAGAIVGAAAGFLTTWGISHWTHVSWMWWALAGGLVTVGIGYLSSLVVPAPSFEQQELTLLRAREKNGVGAS